MGKIIHNRRLCGRLLTAALCAVITITSIGEMSQTVSASTDSAITSLRNKTEQLKKQNEERKKQIEVIKSDVSANKRSMQLANDQIEEINAAIESIREKIGEIDQKSAQIDAVILSVGGKEREIEDKDTKINELNRQNKQDLEEFAKLVRKQYMTDPSDTLTALKDSDDWYEYFVYSDAVKKISGQNILFMERLQASIKQQEALIGELSGSAAALQNGKRYLEEEKADLERKKSELEQEKSDLNKSYSEQHARLISLTNMNEQLQSEISSIQVKINSGEELIKQNNAEIDRIIKAAQEADKNQNVSDDGTFLWPVPSKFRTISTYFGYDDSRSGQHNGIDIVGAVRGAIHNANIYAVQSGTVIAAATLCTHLEPKNMNERHTCGSGYGNYIIIDHGNGLTTLYGHCEKVLVQEGQYVKKGDVIGLVGSAGWSTGYHLHFEARVNNIRKDPFDYKYQYKD